MGMRASSTANSPQLSRNSTQKPLIIGFRASRYPDATLGQRIRKVRLEKGLYQVDLAKKLDVDEMTIVNWELDRTKPKRTYSCKLKECLNIDV